MASTPESFYQRLTRLFRSGPAIRRKIKGQNYKGFYDTAVLQNNLGYYGASAFKREASPFSILGAYGLLDRMSRYAEFAEMDMGSSEVNGALDVYADESCASDEHGRTFHIYSDNPQIQRALEELFLEVVNIELDGRRMFRNLVKNGDFFGYVEVVPDYGVVKVEPIPVNEIEREEGYDKQDPYAVRFKLMSRGGKYLENWQIMHLRILSNDLFIPYGTSFLESGRRLFRQLCHLTGTKVLTDQGHVNIEDVKPGMIVYTHIPESSQTVKTTVKHLVSMGTQPILKVETNHRSILVTPNHGLLTRDRYGNFTYKMAKDLAVSGGAGGHPYVKADALVLPVVVEGNQSIDIGFDSLPAKFYRAKLARSSSAERTGIMDGLRDVKTTATPKAIHAFLQGDKTISLEDLSKINHLLSAEDVVEYYFKGSKRKSLFFPNGGSAIFNKDFFQLFGFMLGDGWTKKNGFGFALGVYDDRNTLYINLAKKLFGSKYIKSTKQDSRSAQVNWNVSEARVIFEKFGFKTGFANKVIPSWVYSLNQECRVAFIRGLFDADGSYSTGTICLANKLLIEQLQQLCWASGVSVGKKITVRPTREGHRESYTLWVDLNKTTKGVGYEKVIRVTEQPAGETWDLEVDHPEHNFVANGIVTHNTMLEDAMLVYRVVRSPERRVFYIDVSAVHPNDIPTYMEAVKETMRGSNVIDRLAGKQDYRYNPVSVDDDYFIPSRRESQTKIETLAGGQHVSATEDVEYIQKKLIAALKVPRAYLTYDENISSKATLAQEDVRFSRTIASLQKIVISELNKLAIIHLYAKGFSGEDLLDFELKFSNPSTVALQQKLQLITSRLETAGKAWELAKETGMMDMEYIQQEILGFRMEQIVRMRLGAQQDQLRVGELKLLSEKKPEPEQNPIVDPFASANYQVPGPALSPSDLDQQKQVGPGQKTLLKLTKPGEGGSGAKLLSVAPGQPPIKANPTPRLDAASRRSSRRKGFNGIGSMAMPNFAGMLDANNRSTSDIYDMEFVNNPLKEFLISDVNSEQMIPNGIPRELASSLRRMDESFKKNEVLDFEIMTEGEEVKVEEDDVLVQIEKELLK